MGKTSFDRVFNRVVGDQARSIEEEEKAAEQILKDFHAKNDAKKDDTPDDIKAILQAWKDKDYFKLLQLPHPTADALGRPVWACTNSDISKAYRKISVLVHPDKNPGEDARQAFEVLNQAHRILKDPDKLADVLKAAAERAQEDQERREAAASMEERISLNATKLQQSKELKKEQTKSFQDEIVAQMRKRQQEAQRRKQLASKYRREEEEEEQEEQQGQQQAAAPAKVGDGSDSDEDRRRRAANLNRKRRRPGQPQAGAPG